MRPQDLNLIMVFDAIMTEQSITRAAERLSMTQPAVSNAVSRMRTAWKDDLFVKDGRNIQPTLYAQNLWQKVKEPIHNLSCAIDYQGFVPATATRTFKVALADLVVDTVWAPLRRLIEEEAPGVNLHAIPYTIVNTEQLLNDAEVDLVVGAGKTLETSVFQEEFLFSPRYVVAMRKNHPLAKPDISLREFADAEHLLVSLSGDTGGITDQVLEQHGLKRRIACTVNHFASVGPLLLESNLIAVVPASTIFPFVNDDSLHVSLPPFDMPPGFVSMLWHKRQQRDAGLSWFNANFKRLMLEHWKTRTESVLERTQCKERE